MSRGSCRTSPDGLAWVLRTPGLRPSSWRGRVHTYVGSTPGRCRPTHMHPPYTEPSCPGEVTAGFRHSSESSEMEKSQTTPAPRPCGQMTSVRTGGFPNKQPRDFPEASGRFPPAAPSMTPDVVQTRPQLALLWGDGTPRSLPATPNPVQPRGVSGRQLAPALPRPGVQRQATCASGPTARGPSRALGRAVPGEGPLTGHTVDGAEGPQHTHCPDGREAHVVSVQRILHHAGGQRDGLSGRASEPPGAPPGAVPLTAICVCPATLLLAPGAQDACRVPWQRPRRLPTPSHLPWAPAECTPTPGA